MNTILNRAEIPTDGLIRSAARVKADSENLVLRPVPRGNGKATPLTLAHFGLTREGNVLPDAQLPATLVADWLADEANAGSRFPATRVCGIIGEPPKPTAGTYGPRTWRHGGLTRARRWNLCCPSRRYSGGPTAGRRKQNPAGLDHRVASVGTLPRRSHVSIKAEAKGR